MKFTKLSSKQVKKLKTGVVGLTLAAALGVAGLSAYFTDQKEAVNTFTVGSVKQELTEPQWDPEDPSHTGITPGQEFDKDPQVKNTGTNDQYVFMTVSIPYANVSIANDDGTKTAPQDTALFNYLTNAGWKQLGDVTKDDNTKTMTYTYYYGTDDAMTVLSKDTTTPALFEKIKFANVVEGQGLQDKQQNVVVKSYGIQTSNLKDATTPSQIWDIVSSQAQQQ